MKKEEFIRRLQEAGWRVEDDQAVLSGKFFCPETEEVVEESYSVYLPNLPEEIGEDTKITVSYDQLTAEGKFYEEEGVVYHYPLTPNYGDTYEDWALGVLDYILNPPNDTQEWWGEDDGITFV